MLLIYIDARAHEQSLTDLARSHPDATASDPPALWNGFSLPSDTQQLLTSVIEQVDNTEHEVCVWAISMRSFACACVRACVRVCFCVLYMQFIIEAVC